MHVHGGPFEMVATDGNVVPEDARVVKDTVNVGPGERYDVVWTAREPGGGSCNCHVPHHTTNNNVEEQGGGGLIQGRHRRDSQPSPSSDPAGASGADIGVPVDRPVGDRRAGTGGGDRLSSSDVQGDVVDDPGPQAAVAREDEVTRLQG